MADHARHGCDHLRHPPVVHPAVGQNHAAADAATQPALCAAPVLSAIIFPEILRHGGAWNVSPLNPRLLAGIIAALVAWRTRNTMLTILAGMAALWGLQALMAR